MSYCTFAQSTTKTINIRSKFFDLFFITHFYYSLLKLQPTVNLLKHKKQEVDTLIAINA